MPCEKKKMSKGWNGPTARLSPPDDLPVLPGCAGRRDRGPTHLGPAFGVDPRDALLGVGSTRQTDVGVLCPEVTVVALVHDESVLGNGRGVDLVGIEQVDEFRGGLGGGCRWSEADIVRSGSRGSL